MYTSCSIALVGDENFCLKCLTCIELYLHASYYAAHPVIRKCHWKGAFLIEATSLSAVLSSSKSFYAADSCCEGSKISTIEVEDVETAESYWYSSLARMLALSIVIQLPIELYSQAKDPNDLKNPYAPLFSIEANDHSHIHTRLQAT